MKKIKVIAVVGPTSVGKSDYAVKLAKKIKGEIISADSRQVYTGLDIGSGKITKKEMGGIPHHILDVANPKNKNVFTVSDFKNLSEKAIEEINKKNKVPIICGGTGFYIDSLLLGLDIPEVPPNNALRKKLYSKSAEALFEYLKKIDPERAKSIDKDNPVRLVRAIEIAKALGRVPNIKINSKYDVEWIGLTADREILRERIVKRLHARLKQGMIKEVKQLHADGVTWKRMYDFGLEYRYCSMLLQNKISKDDFEKILSDKIYQYAMRQLRWFKRNKKIKWIEVK